MIAVLGGIDLIVFTGGIGENDGAVQYDLRRLVVGRRRPWSGPIERPCEGPRLAGRRADSPTYVDDIAGWLTAFEREHNVAQTTILRIGLDLESQLPAHFQHHGILLENLSGYPFQAFRFGVLDDQLHQGPAQAPALEVGSRQNRVLTGLVGCVGVQSHETPSGSLVASSMATNAIARA